jgi:serine/threonine protein kinase/tetratricopeptide (TPR) repeat protein
MGLKASAATASAEAAAVPADIGPYHLLQALGEGGMGLVYLAEQREPLVRRVALKLIKPGMDTREVLARFEAERQVLALMDHPNIARVLDAGLGPGERPYFVMEYVPGLPITDYCDRHRLRNPERLQIFLQVCAALQHAHQKGIIHRDLKPSNILVTVHDASPVPKVIDFGIAKATRQGSVEHAAFTQLGVLVGTPEYISPEQAEASGLEVDTTSDIYSLGVVLYELLTGVLPFDGETLRRAGYAEMRRIIREQDAPKPSLRVTALGEVASEAARQRQTTQPALGKQLRGDLDAIAMKAMEKDRTRRYASPSEFAADITRYLNGEPVVASPPSVLYLTRKFVRRHRLGVAAAAIVLAALVSGLTLSTTFFIRSQAARARAELEAARNRLEAEAMQALIRSDVEAYRSLSEQAMALHRRALGRDNPALAPYLVNHLQLATTFDERLRPETYNASMLEAVGLIEQSLDASDSSGVTTLLTLSDILRPDEINASRLFAKAFELVRRQPKGADRDAPEQLVLLADLIERERTGATPDEEVGSAERISREILALRRAARPASRPHVTASLLRLADVLALKADRLRQHGDPASAAAVYWEERSLAHEAGPGSESRVAEIESELGRCLTALGRFEEAERLLTGSVRVLQAARGERYATTQAAVNGLVGLYEAWGKPDEAERHRTSLPPISVGAVRDVGRVRFPPEVLTRGGGLSASIGGRSVWVFKDTIAFGRGGTSPTRIGSSWGVMEAASSAGPPAVTGPADDGTGAPADLIPRTPTEKGERWTLEPGAVVWHGARNRALVFYAKTRGEGPKSRRAGTSIAVWQPPDVRAARPVLRPGTEDPTLLFDAGEPPLGSGALVVGDWLYAYACEQPEGRFALPCLLARVPMDRALDRREWRFYAGGVWVPDWRSATSVIDAGHLMSVAWNDYLDRYVAVYTPVVSSLIFVRTADRPEGPWSEEIIIEGIAPAVGFQWISSGVGHAELAREGGRVELLTYARHLLTARSETRVVEIEFRKR